MPPERLPPEDPREWLNRARGIDFPFVHDLARLLTLLEQRGESIPPEVADATDLTPYAVVPRYPGVTEPVTVEDHRRAVASAEAVVAWAEERVGSE